MKWKLFANLSEVADARSVDVDVAADATVAEALDALFERHPELRDHVLDDSGDVKEHINVLRNGTNVHNQSGMDTVVDADDELALFPPVSGG